MSLDESGAFGGQSIDVARRLWERSVGSQGRDLDIDAATDRVLTDLERALRRWVGAEGYAALLNRAVAITLPHHPALAHIEDLSVSTVTPGGLTATAEQVSAAVIALLATVLDLLGRIVGNEMAMRLVDQMGQPSPRGVVSTEPEESRDVK